MNPTFKPVTTTFRRQTGSTRFVDSPPPTDLSTSTISKIIIHHSTLINSLAVYYSWNNGHPTTCGDTGGRRSEIVFDDDEFITRIEGLSTKAVIFRLTFVTTKRRCGPYGGSTGEAFVWDTADGYPAPRMRFGVSNGHNDHALLRGFQAKFKPYHESPSQPVPEPALCDPPKTALYESLSTVSERTFGSSPAANTSLPLSKFNSHIMSPIATLYVGQERVQFHAHEDTLCKLPFFEAALQGQSKEASEKTIAMPEDDPSKISALIEFLYVGNYTYAYDSGSVQLREGSNTPPGDLTEGLYHVGVHVVASKYGCPGLSKLALKNFEAVGNELDNINTLRLWKAAYNEGLLLPRRKQDLKLYGSGEGLVSWVKGLFGQHYEEMNEMVSTCPQLASDLFRLVMTDD